jgi:hypothetical protein
LGLLFRLASVLWKAAFGLAPAGTLLSQNMSNAEVKEPTGFSQSVSAARQCFSAGIGQLATWRTVLLSIMCKQWIDLDLIVVNKQQKV